METVHTVRTGSELVTAADAVLVTITVLRDVAGRPMDIAVHAGPDDPVVRWVRPGTAVPEALPTEVQWFAMDLAAGERLRLEAKPEQHPFFRWTRFELDERNHAVSSDKVVYFQPLLGHRQSWTYGVTLESPQLAKPLVLDPVIIIEEYP